MASKSPNSPDPALPDATQQGEDALVAKLRKALGHPPSSLRSQLKLGLGDDAALWLPSPGHETILTCDWFLEGTHFWRDAHPADSVGWKCLARAVSDIAAMGGEPRCFLLSLAMPETHTGKWLEEFLAGLRRASRELQCAPAGGDTTRNKKILINVSVVGERKKGCAALRSGARPGDVICVSGRLGGAQLGLEQLQQTSGNRNENEALRKHLYPSPRIDLGQWLVKKRLVTAMMDLSDGLSRDLNRLCTASRVGARINEAALPLARGLPEQESQRLRAALHGGDDYELLFTVPKKKSRLLPPSFRSVPITVVGEIRKEQQVVLNSGGASRPLKIEGWDPFHDADVAG